MIIVIDLALPRLGIIRVAFLLTALNIQHRLALKRLAGRQTFIRMLVHHAKNQCQSFAITKSASEVFRLIDKVGQWSVIFQLAVWIPLEVAFPRVGVYAVVLHIWRRAGPNIALHNECDVDDGARPDVDAAGIVVVLML